jgi:hypothetical protein
MSGRLLTRKERAEATKEYLSKSHPPIELDRGMYLLCHCKEFDCKPHRAHFHELRKFNEEATRVTQPLPRKKATSSATTVTLLEHRKTTANVNP